MSVIRDCGISQYRYVQRRAMKTLQLMLMVVLFGAIFSVTSAEPEYKFDPRIITPGANGTEVVHAAVAEIEIRGIFRTSDHRFLRRLAYVETRDGTDQPNSPVLEESGGIWNFSSSKLRHIQNASSLNGKMEEINSQIEYRFGIDILLMDDGMRHDHMKKPLYSGVATRFYLYYLGLLGTSIPPTIAGQAKFWVKYFCVPNRSRPCSVTSFLQLVTYLNQLGSEDCRVKADIFFVLDMSNSITATTFQKARIFTSQFVQNMTIGPNATQVGVIGYGNDGRVEINLNTYKNKTDLLEGIDSIPFNTYRQATNTADALCKLVRHGFTRDGGARDSSATVYRVAILLSDGYQNLRSQECNWDIKDAVEEVRKLSPEVLVYVIGVSNDDEETLKAIASHESYYNHIDNMDTALQRVREVIEDNICWKATIEYKKDTSINGSLNKNNIARYILAVPTESGITVKVCVGNGRVIVNGTISDDENDPIHSFNFVLVCNNCEGNQKCKNATAPPNSPPTSKRKRSSSNEEATVYISVTGLEQENTFIMSSTEGHVREFPAHTDASDASVRTPTTAATTPQGPVGDTHKTVFIIATASSSGLLLIVISCILIICSVYAFTVYRAKKKQQTKAEDECGLLDNEYVEM